MDMAMVAQALQIPALARLLPRSSNLFNEAWIGSMRKCGMASAAWNSASDAALWDEAADKHFEGKHELSKESERMPKKNVAPGIAMREVFRKKRLDLPSYESKQNDAHVDMRGRNRENVKNNIGASERRFYANGSGVKRTAAGKDRRYETQRFPSMGGEGRTERPSMGREGRPERGSYAAQRTGIRLAERKSKPYAPSSNYEVGEDADSDQDEDPDDSQDLLGKPRWDSKYEGIASRVPTLKGEVVYGIGPIKAALRSQRREIYYLYAQEGLTVEIPNKRKDKNDVRWILDTSESSGVKIVSVTKHVLNMLADNRPHQGFILDASPLELVRVDTLEPPLIAGDRVPVWVALDEVTDPQNFGAILRSAYFFGADGVVVCAKNSAPLSGVVSKASAGAMEAMELMYCKNMVKFLENSIENGWRVVGSSTDAGTLPLQELPGKVPTIVVLGNEGTGLRTNIKRACTDMVRIWGSHMAGNSTSKKMGSNLEYQDKSIENSIEDEIESNLESQPAPAEDGEDIPDYKKEPDPKQLFGVVDSLNVSVAAGVLLHKLLMPSAASNSCQDSS